MRILKFIGVAIGSLVLVFFLVFGFNLDALNTLFKNSGDLQEGQEWVSKTTSLKDLTEYIAANPRNVSVVSQSSINPDTTINFRGDESRTMGTLSNFFLITTYARLVEADSLNPKELISIKDTDVYQVPFIDASNHDDAINFLENKGAITSDNETSLHELVKAAIIFNDLAISDYLYFRLGQNAILNTMDKLELSDTDVPLPFSGLYITLNPAITEKDFLTHFEQLQTLSRQSFEDTVLAKAHQFQTDSLYRQRVLRTFETNDGLKIQFSERRDMLDLFPATTAQELSELMVQLENNELLSQPISRRVKEIMDWPFEQQSLNSDFNHYGAIYDSRLGLLNGIDYGASTYSGEPFGQAVFFDSLQVAFWFHMSSNLMHQDYQQRLMWDPALRETTLQQINN
ncbi:hypothetical protein LQ318_07640 [Aliifodinibius salicampi]|uniref:Beta-lactamase class A catalytic domain-containing protein n=1 Tax=Fodinibius salicampi TaxID=1920655 RepID=A0ABT3PY58_9BACT|nr:serine hydrolase [Fodinibius salicampi]MCW9712773.1 hypothetical protein [Fodinibius salicampi]